MKIIGNTVGTPLPKPNLLQDDPSKGDYVKGKSVIDTRIEKALDEYTKKNPIGENGFTLVDHVTDEVYQFYVSDGHFSMDKLEDGDGNAELVMTDKTTVNKYKIYVSSGKLTMEEV